MYYAVDSFTDQVFGGGPAAVVCTERALQDDVMQNIAAENNLPDTAFIVKERETYSLRWFMPNGEINLNGHATLAAAYCLFNFIEPGTESVAFRTKSGILKAEKEGDFLALDMPAVFNKPIAPTAEMIEALGGGVPQETYFGQNLFFVFDSETAVKNVRPDFEKMKQLPLGQGCFISAVGDESDIVGRTFWPKMGVNEDSVCGNMHCNLTPFWCRRLGKKEIVSRQLSKRGATVICEDCGDRVKLKGKAVLFLKGELCL